MRSRPLHAVARQIVLALDRGRAALTAPAERAGQAPPRTDAAPHETVAARGEILRRVRREAERLYPPAIGATADADLKAVEGWDSLASLNLHVALEDTFAISLPGELFARSCSLQSLAQAVAERLSPGEPTAGAAVDAPGAPQPRGAITAARGELRGLWGVFRPRLDVSLALSRLMPDFSLVLVRSRLLRLGGFDLKKHAAVLGRIRVAGAGDIASRLHLESGCVIAPNVTFGLDEHIFIGKNVSIGPNAVLYTAGHEIGFGLQRMARAVAARPITVEDGAWIGMNALVLPGVKVGRGSVIAAGAVVSADVPAHTLVSGNPAVVNRTLPGAER